MENNETVPVEKILHSKTPLSQVHWKDYLAAKKYDSDINNMCKTCIENQISFRGEITIKCKGLATKESIMPEGMEHVFTLEELDRIEEIANPYFWAEKHLNPRIFAKRWYQEHASRCTAKRKVLRMGRRTGKSYKLALNIVHKVLTNDNYKVLIVTPYEVQAEELINYVRDFIYALDETYGDPKSLLVKDVKSPTYKMEFSNGSRIRAFTTGSSGATSVRGQRADLIVLDEVDYMSEADFGAILAILMDNPEVEMWVASTPDGKKTLYKLEQMKEYKGFHFPSFVIPHFNDDLDQELKEEYTDIQYVQEVMAEYGESMKGVFQRYFLDLSSKKDVDVSDILSNRNRYIIILGGDWNDDMVGTRLLAVAFDTYDKKFRVVDRQIVSKEGWTQVEAVQKIIDMNRAYKFDAIYLDEGYGKSSIQFIKKYAIDKFGKVPKNHPDLKLADTVGINFSSSLTVKDIHTGEELKKDMKVYMVDNAVRMLERGSLEFDSKLDHSLLEQMENYIVARRTPTGKPVYEAEDDKIGDHDLDAYMLALLGFAMEYAELSNHQSEMVISVLSRNQMDSSKDTDAESEIRNATLEQAIKAGLFATLGGSKSPDNFLEKKIGSNRSTLKPGRINRGKRILYSPDELHKDPDINYNRNFNNRNTFINKGPRHIGRSEF